MVLLRKVIPAAPLQSYFHMLTLQIIADEMFKDIHVRHIGPKLASHGFSSFKFLPYSNDNIIGKPFHFSVRFKTKHAHFYAR